MSENHSDSLAALKGLTSAVAVVTDASIHAYLAAQPELEGRPFRIVLNAEALAAGASGGTVLFDIEGEDLPDSLRGAYVLRYELGGAGIFSQTSLRSQFDIMRALGRHDIPVPGAAWLDENGVIAAGQPALIMRRVFARAPNIQYLQTGFFAESNAQERATMMRYLFAVAAKLHAIPLAALDLPALDARGGAGKHFIDREIDWVLAELRARFPDVETCERAELHTGMRKTLESAAVALRDTAPRHRQPVLAHGDLTIANTMYRDDRSVAALLDWELAHHGLPEMDVAYFLAAMSGIASLGAPVIELPTEAETIRYYEEAGGRIADFDYCRAFAAFRVAVWGAIGMRRMPPEFWPAQKRMWEIHGAQLADAMQKL